jgi:hypothetical protein
MTGIVEASPHAAAIKRMLESASHPFSPAALHASLQTSIHQARNRTAGAAMSVFKKSDVKNHLSVRVRAKTYLNAPVSQPDATDRSLTGPDPTASIPLTFADDYSGEHSVDGAGATPVVNSIDSTGSRKPDASKSARI